MNAASGGVGSGGGVAATSDASLSGVLIPKQLGAVLHELLSIPVVGPKPVVVVVALPAGQDPWTRWLFVVSSALPLP